MADGPATLPLFPLGTVLVPGTRLPLQIFEPRYVVLLRDLIEAQDDQPPVFGVVAIREGHEVGEHNARSLHAIGCGAQVTQVAVLGDNRFLVVTEATQRFRIESLHAAGEGGEADEAGGAPYVRADVAWLDEPLGDIETTSRLAAKLRAEIVAYRSLAHADDLDLTDLDPTALSYATTATIALTVADRQRLLEAPDTEARLHLALALAHREHELATSLGTVTLPYEPPSL